MPGCLEMGMSPHAKNWDFNLHDFDQALTGATLHTALFRVKTGATQSLCRKFN